MDGRRIMDKLYFEQWAKNIYLFLGEGDSIRHALEHAYEMGYQTGLNKGWAIEQDREANIDHESSIRSVFE